jgi:hypothetical protein
MTTRLSIRAKLSTAALSLLFVLGLGLFYRAGAYKLGEIIFRVVCLVFGSVLAFGGMFRNGLLQVLWGYCLAFAALLLVIALCIGAVHGSAAPWAIASVTGAFIGSYFLLLDKDVKTWRENTQKKKVA